MPDLSTANPPKSCLICGTPVTVPYYGVDACRACASFFKRAKVSGKSYICRQGDRRCMIAKDAKFICRRCRYDRCVASGMVYDKTMTAIANNNLVESPPVYATKLSPTDYIGPSTSLDPPKPMGSILRRIGTEYRISVERRRYLEDKLMSAKAGCKLAPHPTMKIYEGTYESAVEIFDITADETRLLYEKAFPKIKKLKKEEQDLLLKSYMPKFAIIDNLHRTRLVYGGLKSRLGMTSVVCSVDLSEGVDAWLGEQKGAGNRASLVSFLEAQNDMQFEFLLPLMTRAHTTNKEFYALIALVLCEIDSVEEVPESLLELTDEIRAEVFEDLQRYYLDDMGLNDFSTRLGNLVTFNHAVRECVYNSKEYIRLQKSVFDLYETAERINEILLYLIPFI